MAYVTIRMKNTEGYSQVDLTKDRMVLGRSSKTDMPIKHTSISREHCAFVRQEGEWLVEDLGSSNGTWVNKTKVVGRIQIKERDIIKTGQARLTFHAGARKADGEPEAAIDLNLEDDDGAKGPTVKVGADDPPEAMVCGHCAAWFSIAHRLAGETMHCPRCDHSNIVPSMST